MDESEKRMERLKAMRNEAAEGEALSANQVTRVSGFQSGLANPLTDASPLQERPRSAHRFDYYTDPMASFYANRKGHVDSHVPRGFVLNPGHVLAPPVRQMLPHPDYNLCICMVFAMNPFPRPITYQRGVRPFNASFSYRPFGSENPYISHQEFPPGIRNQLSSAASYHPQPNFPRGANFLNPGAQSGTHDFSSVQGRGQPFHGSYSGRGRGNWAENKARMGSEQRSSRNVGSANSTSKSLYEKFMVDDPWKSLKPSIWREEKSNVSLPSSKIVGVKRHLKISGPSTPSSQSLAE